MISKGPHVSACLGKRAYETYEEAINVVRRMRVRIGEGYLVPYECTYCGYWHTGHDRRTGV